MGSLVVSCTSRTLACLAERQQIGFWIGSTILHKPVVLGLEGIRSKVNYRCLFVT